MVVLVDALQQILETSPIIAVSIVFVIAMALLALAAAQFVGALSKIAKTVGISGFIIGTLILAIGTTLPEFTNTLVANFLDLADLGIGDIIGASVTNICLIMGVVSLMQTTKFERKGFEEVTFGVALLAILLFTFLGSDGIISRLEGLLLFSIFVAFQIYSYRQGVTVSHKKILFKKVGYPYIVSIMSVFVIITASYLVVESSEILSLNLNVAPAIIGLTIIALGTTMPELSSSIAASLKGEAEMAFGDLVGACILNLLFAAGVVAMIRPLAFHFVLFKVPLMFLFSAVAILISYVYLRKKADRLLAVILLSTYATYLAYNILQVI